MEDGTRLPGEEHFGARMEALLRVDGLNHDVMGLAMPILQARLGGSPGLGGSKRHDGIAPDEAGR